MDKRRAQVDSAHQTGLKPTLHAFLIVVESGDTEGWKSCRNFSPSGIGDVLACISTTIDPMDKRRPQRDSAHQTGLKPPLHAFLIAGCWCFTRWWRNFRRIEFFALRLWRCSGHPCNNQQSYGQMDVTAEFSRSERSRNIFGRHSNCSGRLVYGREKSPIRLGLENTHGSCLSTHIPQIA